jgi:hypothetical protein
MAGRKLVLFRWATGCAAFGGAAVVDETGVDGKLPLAWFCCWPPQAATPTMIGSTTAAAASRLRVLTIFLPKWMKPSDPMAWISRGGSGLAATCRTVMSEKPEAVTSADLRFFGRSLEQDLSSCV